MPRIPPVIDAPPSCSFATIRRPKTEKPRAKPIKLIAVDIFCSRLCVLILSADDPPASLMVVAASSVAGSNANGGVSSVRLHVPLEWVYSGVVTERHPMEFVVMTGGLHPVTARFRVSGILFRNMLSHTIIGETRNPLWNANMVRRRKAQRAFTPHAGRSS
jgi:hypothetical protein